MTRQLLAREAVTFEGQVARCGDGDLRAREIDTIQVNIGLTCNLACHHCHVESSPKRTEQMSWETMEMVLRAAEAAGASTVDITGGAPEMNPFFRQFVAAARGRSLRVIVRTNLTILLTPEHAGLPEFFKEQRVHLVASLPCYLAENVDRQRGRNVHEGSIEVLRRLNAVGYGRTEGLEIDLVFNPSGPSLPPSQERLEADYRRVLRDDWGIEFNRLITITNMPIGRFQADLDRSGSGDAYWELLEQSFNPDTVPGLMCRNQVHVGWDGTLSDCDFNHALALPVVHGVPGHVRDFDAESLRRRRVATGRHCLGCTAGAGSSCGGSLT